MDLPKSGEVGRSIPDVEKMDLPGWGEVGRSIPDVEKMDLPESGEVGRLIADGSPRIGSSWEIHPLCWETYRHILSSNGGDPGQRETRNVVVDDLTTYNVIYM